ncbi:Uncharacterized protein conserved in bacteria [Actinomyces bovis]|uniref:Uncharacterized protein conserved in bacteria n=1 Tax=Actinomyces bovis TaxID=1658 RepID=A0ABY1VPY5_9ACTO|nr:DUF4870 domain-containing protein [Actinomyces bovis]SPT53502.1 Uncharacterized protein conserved in bacteria [Actinomyces bovis]VEG55418.1 Uncharacterized protein conserved in bacteria [Actinomyces israelii]
MQDSAYPGQTPQNDSPQPPQAGGGVPGAMYPGTPGYAAAGLSNPYSNQVPSTCAAPWLLGLLGVAPILGVLTGFLQAGVGLAMGNQAPEPARTQARQAASWGLTYSILAVLLLSAHLYLLFTMTRDKPVKEFFPLGIPITIFGLLTLVHLILAVVGGVRASKGKTMPFYGVPFFR